MMDSYLGRWADEVGNREDRDHLAAMPIETVNSYWVFQIVAGFKEAGLVAHIQGTLKQDFGVHPIKASETGLSHSKYEFFFKCMCRELIMLR